MTTDEIGKRLHDQATRGEALSMEEQAQLESWYKFQDSSEMDQLGLAADRTTVLQAQVDAATAQQATITKQIQEIAKENQALRHEISTLRRQLAQQTLLQPA